MKTFVLINELKELWNGLLLQLWYCGRERGDVYIYTSGSVGADH